MNEILQRLSRAAIDGKLNPSSCPSTWRAADALRTLFEDDSEQVRQPAISAHEPQGSPVS
jgi:hypothetical protein